MLRRSVVVALVAALAALVVLPSSALALRAHVRVEGATVTIFGATDPLVDVTVGTLPVDGGAPLTLTKPTALGALEGASIEGEFFYQLKALSFGPYVSQIGRNAASDTSGWVYKVNGVSPPVGADAYDVKANDEVLWYWATFGPAGGPPTLDLVPAKRGCYRAYAVDDTGKRTLTGVEFRLDARSVRSTSGRICPAGEWSTLSATKDGAVRSQVVTH